LAARAPSNQGWPTPLAAVGDAGWPSLTGEVCRTLGAIHCRRDAHTRRLTQRRRRGRPSPPSPLLALASRRILSVSLSHVAQNPRDITPALRETAQSADCLCSRRSHQARDAVRGGRDGTGCALSTLCLRSHTPRRGHAGGKCLLGRRSSGVPLGSRLGTDRGHRGVWGRDSARGRAASRVR
jgi:hypothetical protein